MQHAFDEHLATNRYYDRNFQAEAAKILPGEYCVSDRGMLLVTVVGSSLAFSLGMGASSYLGTVIPAAISGYAIGGTTLGAFGVMACGTVFAIGFAVAAGAYVNHFSS